jgi:hypothetical protein
MMGSQGEESGGAARSCSGGMAMVPWRCYWSAAITIHVVVEMGEEEARWACVNETRLLLQILEHHRTHHAARPGLVQAGREQSSADGDSGGVLGEHQRDDGLLGRARRRCPQVNAVAETWPSGDLDELADALDSDQPEPGERAWRPCWPTRMMTPFGRPPGGGGDILRAGAPRPGACLPRSKRNSLGWQRRPWPCLLQGKPAVRACTTSAS